jgi:hypothetical protein
LGIEASPSSNTLDSPDFQQYLNLKTGDGESGRGDRLSFAAKAGDAYSSGSLDNLQPKKVTRKTFFESQQIMPAPGQVII